MVKNSTTNFGEMLHLQRVTMHLTLQQLATKAKVSPSHLGRIEKGTRFPSARVLKRIAKPLGYNENQLFTLAGYLTQDFSSVTGKAASGSGHLDPYVGRMLAQEPLETQQAVIGILAIMKNLARNNNKSGSKVSPAK
ncbi:MAG: helix-turn-helix transcriptional regulator [Dehalococcoidales bacterium]|nr:helix-turn-helix transcriptional regulator [Dehalococcoidales bacterium]